MPTTCKGFHRRRWERGFVVVYREETMTATGSLVFRFGSAIQTFIPWRRFDDDIPHLRISCTILFPNYAPRLPMSTIPPCPSLYAASICCTLKFCPYCIISPTSIFHHVYIRCISPFHIFYRVLDAYLGLVLFVTLYVHSCKCVGFVGLLKSLDLMFITKTSRLTNDIQTRRLWLGVSANSNAFATDTITRKHDATRRVCRTCDDGCWPIVS